MHKLAENFRSKGDKSDQTEITNSSAESVHIFSERNVPGKLSSSIG